MIYGSLWKVLAFRGWPLVSYTSAGLASDPNERFCSLRSLRVLYFLIFWATVISHDVSHPMSLGLLIGNNTLQRFLAVESLLQNHWQRKRISLIDSQQLAVGSSLSWVPWVWLGAWRLMNCSRCADDSHSCIVAGCVCCGCDWGSVMPPHLCWGCCPCLCSVSVSVR